jgi:hypothetical protein
MFKLIEPRTRGRNWDDSRKDEVRVSVQKDTAKNLQVHITIGVNVASGMGWKNGDRADVYIDPEKSIFSISKSEAGTGYKLHASAGKGNAKEQNKTLSLKISNGKGRIPFIKSRHVSTCMIHSIKNNGKELWISYKP